MIYKTVPAILLKMVTEGELTTKQAASIRDAHENERAEWRSQLIEVCNAAYEAGRKRDPIARGEIILSIVNGGCDI